MKYGVTCQQKSQVCSGLLEIWPTQCENLNTLNDSIVGEMSTPNIYRA